METQDPMLEKKEDIDASPSSKIVSGTESRSCRKEFRFAVEFAESGSVTFVVFVEFVVLPMLEQATSFEEEGEGLESAFAVGVRVNE